MKIVFMGTAGFAVPPLKTLLDSEHEVTMALTQPDRRKGRGRSLAPPPVKEALLNAGLERSPELFQPENINSDEAYEAIAAHAPDVIVVVAYGQLLKKRLLDIPKHGCINIHASLLPILRGAAPINWSIVNGDAQTGVTTMYMDVGMDTGDILLKSEIDIDDTMNSVELGEKISQMGSELLTKTLDMILAGKLVRVKQDEARATYAPIIKKSDGIIDFAKKDARQIHDMVRGFTPWPGASTTHRNSSLKIIKTYYDFDLDTARATPGTVISVSRESFYVATKKGALELFELQPQGKKIMKARDFINGYRLTRGEVLGGI